MYTLLLKYNYFKSLVTYNLLYFLILRNVFQKFILLKSNINEGDIPIALWKRILCFNIFDMLIYLPYKIYEMIKTMRYIDKIFIYLGEKICYDFNLNKKN